MSMRKNFKKPRENKHIPKRTLRIHSRPNQLNKKFRRQMITINRTYNK